MARYRLARAELEPREAGQDLAGIYLLNGPEYLEATSSRTARALRRRT